MTTISPFWTFEKLSFTPTVLAESAPYTATVAVNEKVTPMYILDPIVRAIIEHGVVLILAAIVVFGLFARARRESRGENAAGHIIESSSQVNSQWQELVRVQAGQIQGLLKELSNASEAYRTAVQGDMFRRLEHCEAEHKNAESRLVEAHQRISEEGRQREMLQSELNQFRAALAGAAIQSANSKDALAIIGNLPPDPHGKSAAPTIR